MTVWRGPCGGVCGGAGGAHLEGSIKGGTRAARGSWGQVTTKVQVATVLGQSPQDAVIGQSCHQEGPLGGTSGQVRPCVGSVTDGPLVGRAGVAKACAGPCPGVSLPRLHPSTVWCSSHVSVSVERPRLSIEHLQGQEVPLVRSWLLPG